MLTRMRVNLHILSMWPLKSGLEAFKQFMKSRFTIFSSISQIALTINVDSVIINK